MLYNWNDMRFVKAILTSNWQSLLKYTILFGFLAGLLFWQLASLLPGYTPAEQATYAASGLHALYDNPLNAPYLLAVKALIFVHGNDLLVTRIAASAAGLVFLGCFCWLLYRWHGSRIAIMGTLLFGTSAWFLHIARMGTPDVLLFGTIALLAAGFWLKESRSVSALLVNFVVAALLLYTPGMIWFIAAGVIWQWKTINYIFKERLASVSLGGIVLLLLLAPLVWALMRDHQLISLWLGLPTTWPAPADTILEAIKVPYHLLISNAPEPARWLGTAPILDVFSIAGLVLGLILYLRNIRLSRTPLLITLLIIGTGLVALSGPNNLSFIVPLLYIIIATGIGYILDQWLQVFPRNPIARSIGYIFVSLAVAITCTYHLRHYFVGWPAARTTADSYFIKEP
jgi:hypothetical protein